MQELLSTVCRCGKPMFDGGDRCAACDQCRQKRLSHDSYELPARSAKQLSASPGRPSPSRYICHSMPTPATSMHPRAPSVGEAFTSAFASQGGPSNLFPPSLYRTPNRSANVSRQGSSSSTFSGRSFAPDDQANLTSKTRATTPDVRPADSAYAPMAAGFARLSRKDDYARSSMDDPTHRRTASARASLDLGARLFSGAA